LTRLVLAVYRSRPIVLAAVGGKEIYMSIQCKARDLKGAMTKLWNKEIGKPRFTITCPHCKATMKVAHLEWISVGCPSCDEDVLAKDLGARK